MGASVTSLDEAAGLYLAHIDVHAELEAASNAEGAVNCFLGYLGRVRGRRTRLGLRLLNKRLVMAATAAMVAAAGNAAEAARVATEMPRELFAWRDWLRTQGILPPHHHARACPQYITLPFSDVAVLERTDEDLVLSYVQPGSGRTERLVLSVKRRAEEPPQKGNSSSSN